MLLLLQCRTHINGPAIQRQDMLLFVIISYLLFLVIHYYSLFHQLINIGA
jgi:hypothetical protein